MNWHTYILESLVQKKFYVGHTDNLLRRLEEHNSGKSYYTKQYLPWKIIHSEDYETLEEAVEREKYLKSHAGRRWTKKNVGL